ncbi:MAG: hypothetical protein N3B13_03815 [Deltaproteobacteria bacterium]|nr:hypothetical protein [Deltaproteobacteria bacterium]
MNKHILLCFAVCIFLLSGFTDISEGNKLFLASDYKGAAARYSEIVKKDIEDANLFFNLATSYLYSGEYGKAVYWYYRTLLLEGAREDTIRNLKMAYRGLEEDGIAAAETDSVIYDFLLKYFHPVLSVIFIVLINLMFFILILRKFLPIKRGVNIFFFFLSAIVIFLAIVISLRIYFVHFQSRGIVIVKSAEVKEGPSEAYKTIYRADEGSMVRITETYQNFFRIEASGGKIRGWVESDNIGLLKAGKL